MESYLFYYLLIIIMILSFCSKIGQEILFKRNASDWILDGLSLLNHFILIPSLQALIIVPILIHFFSDLKGTLQMGWGLAILANMLIDYGWYWNHRLFHARTKLWSLHAVHHEPEELDILKSPRNSFWSPFLMVYFWLIPIFLYLANDPFPFLFITGCSLVINFWGHTHLNFPAKSLLRKLANNFLIQPKDHKLSHRNSERRLGRT